MNAQSHYAEAERLVKGWLEAVESLDSDLTDAQLHAEVEHGASLASQSLAAAQVHATLALAAATALAGSETERQAWLDVNS